MANVSVEVLELTGHVCQRCETIRMQIFVLEKECNTIGDDVKAQRFAYSHFQHVVLNRSNDHKYDEAAEGDLAEDPLAIPAHVVDHVLVDVAVEELVLGQDEQDNQRHVRVLVGEVAGLIEVLQDREHEHVDVRRGEDVVPERCVSVQHRVHQQGALRLPRRLVESREELAELHLRRGRGVAIACRRDISIGFIFD